MGDDLTGKSGYIDTSGKFVIPAQFSSAGPFSHGIAVACVGDGSARKCGYISR